MDETPSVKPPSAVVMAVRDKYLALRKSLVGVEAEARNTEQAARAAALKLSELRADLDVLGKYLESQADELDGWASSSDPPAEVQETALPARAANLQVILRAKELLSDGTPRSTHQILSELRSIGAGFFASNPLQRLSQLLSASELFVNDRATGWSLKGEDPAPTGSSCATKSERDEP